MPLFIVERNFAEQVELSRDIVTEAIRVNTDVDIKWLSSFLSADKKKSYCLYEAPNAEAIREAARRLNMPADTITVCGIRFVEDMGHMRGDGSRADAQRVSNLLVALPLGNNPDSRREHIAKRSRSESHG